MRRLQALAFGLLVVTASFALATDSSLTNLIKSKDRSASNIRAIQTELVALGYDPGPADGKIGKKTRTALQDWNGKQAEPLSLDWLNTPTKQARKCRDVEGLGGLVQECDAPGEVGLGQLMR